MSRQDTDRQLARGTVVNFVGLLAKALHPAFFLLVARMYGLGVYGVFAIAYNALELLSSFLTGGYKAGLILFGGRHAHRDDEESQAIVYDALANALVIVGAVSAAVIPLAALVGDDLLSGGLPTPGVGRAFAVLALALPFMSITELCVAATRSLMIMKYDALLLGFLRPLLMVGLAIAAWAVEPGLYGLTVSFVAAQALLAAVATAVFVRHFSMPRLWRAITRFRYFPPLTRFAVPQTLHMTLADSTTKIDVLMLAYFGVPRELVGLYDIAGKLVRMLRQVKIGFSNALAPLIARLHEAGERVELEARFAQVSRWSATVAIPMVLLIAGLGDELLGLFASDGEPLPAYDPAFMAVLTIHPFLVAIVGLAGNVLVMTGYSRLTLANSAAAVAVNVALNWILIPRVGLMGAAAASAVTSAVMHAAQVVEVWSLLSIRLRWSLLWTPFAAGAVGAVALAGAWAGIDADGTTRSIAATAAGLLAYGATLWQLRGRGDAPG